ncbi:MAG: hypothetical protein HXS51_14725 [Theionarchaea archaeon]|nr:hypothetical protein [Theionarchaea archaeon]
MIERFKRLLCDGRPGQQRNLGLLDRDAMVTLLFVYSVGEVPLPLRLVAH